MVTVTDILNQWNEIGVFSYVLPFLVVFAVVFAILEKTKVLGQNAKGVNVIISVALGLLSLLNDYVSTFFATLAPRFGVVLMVLLVIVVLIGLFAGDDWADDNGWRWLGVVAAIVAVVWALNNWWYVPVFQGGYFGGWWNSESFTTLIAIALLIGGVWAIVHFSEPMGKKKKKGETH